MRPFHFLLLIASVQLCQSHGDAQQLRIQEKTHVFPKLINLEVICAKDHMRVYIEFSAPFNGIIFSKGNYGHPKCTYVIPNSGITHANFDIYYNNCGTKKDILAKFHENTIIVQYGTDVIEAWDEAKRIRCEWPNAYEQPASKPAIKIADIDVVELEFQGDNVDCWMEIQEGKGPWAHQVSGIIPIGSPLTMVIAIMDHEGQFDMKVKSCWAYDGFKKPIMLTDDNGCVLRPKMLTPFLKVRDYNGRASIISYSYFYAFKFPDSMDVHVQCKVQICRHHCPESCAEHVYSKMSKEPFSSNENINFIQEPIYPNIQEQIASSAQSIKDQLQPNSPEKQEQYVHNDDNVKPMHQNDQESPDKSYDDKKQEKVYFIQENQHSQQQNPSIQLIYDANFEQKDHQQIQSYQSESDNLSKDNNPLETTAKYPVYIHQVPIDQEKLSFQDHLDQKNQTLYRPLFINYNEMIQPVKPTYESPQPIYKIQSQSHQYIPPTNNKDQSQSSNIDHPVYISQPDLSYLYALMRSKNEDSSKIQKQHKRYNYPYPIPQFMPRNPMYGMMGISDRMDNEFTFHVRREFPGNPRSMRKRRNANEFGVHQTYQVVASTDLDFEINSIKDDTPVWKGHSEDIDYGICLSLVSFATCFSLIIALILSSVTTSIFLYFKVKRKVNKNNLSSNFKHGNCFIFFTNRRK